MSKLTLMATGLIALAMQIASPEFVCAAPSSDDGGSDVAPVKDAKTSKPVAKPSDKQLKKGSKVEKRERAEAKKDSLSPAGGAGPVGAGY